MIKNELNIENQVFEDMRERLSGALQATLKTMMRRSAREATVDLKIHIKNDLDKVIEDEEGLVHMAPEFGFKISMSVPLKGTLEIDPLQGVHAVIGEDGAQIFRDQVSFWDMEGGEHGPD